MATYNGDSIYFMRHPLGDVLPPASDYFAQDFAGFGGGICCSIEDTEASYILKVYNNLCDYISVTCDQLRENTARSGGVADDEDMIHINRVTVIKYAVTLITPLIPENKWRTDFDDFNVLDYQRVQ